MGSWKEKFGITAVLTVTFGGLIALSIGILLFLSLSNVLESTRSDLSGRINTLIGEAAKQSEAYFQPLEKQAKWLATEILSGNIDPESPGEFELLLKGAVSTLPQIAGISYQYPNGSGVFYDARGDVLKQVEWPSRLQVRLNRSDTNPQTNPDGNGIWVLRPSVLDGTPASTFIYPVRTPNGDIGAIAVRVDLYPLSQSLATDAIFRDHELVRFILFNNRVVLGHPLLKDMDEVSRPSVDDLDDPYLRQLGTGERFPLTIVGDIPGVETFSLQTDDGQRVFAIKQDTSRRAGGELTVGVHFNPTAGATELRRLATVAIIGTLLLASSVIITFFLGRWAAAPMKQLARAAQLVQSNRLEEISPLPVSPVKEVAAAEMAFNEMVIGLKERVKIRDLFGKYVPQNVATMLLSDDSTAEPKNATATVLFLDLVGFSTISEKLSPAAIVDTMNAFFSDAVKVIESEGGMVTQFQGDAILAVFNVPLPQDDHASCAIRAALSITESIEKRDYAGCKLRCRIGINTGSLVAGAIGARDRLSYTVYGDAVNVAARLEQMNKEFGTQILVAGDTVDLAAGFAFKAIGNLPIRGRDTQVEVYTVTTD